MLERVKRFVKCLSLKGQLKQIQKDYEAVKLEAAEHERASDVLIAELKEKVDAVEAGPVKDQLVIILADAIAHNEQARQRRLAYLADINLALMISKVTLETL